MRVIGKHPADGKPVELFAGRYGPYVKHGGVNATGPDRDKLDSLTLDEAVELIAAKGGKGLPARKSTARAAAVEPAAPKPARTPAVSRVGAAKKTSPPRTAAKTTAKTARTSTTARTAKKTSATKPAAKSARKGAGKR